MSRCLPVREMADEIRALSGAPHRRILEPNRNRPHRETAHDWRDRQLRPTFHSIQHDEFSGPEMIAGNAGGRLRWMIEPCGWRWSAIGMLRTREISRSNMKSTARMLCLIIRNRASGSAAGTTFKKADSSSQTRSVLRSGELSAAAISGSLNSYLPMTAYHLTR